MTFCWNVQLTIDFHALDRKSTRLNSSHVRISYAVFCLKKKKIHISFSVPVTYNLACLPFPIHCVYFLLPFPFTYNLNVYLICKLLFTHPGLSYPLAYI